MVKIEKIDAHQHFWRYNTEEYGWIKTGMEVLKKNHLSEDFAPLLRSAGIDGTVAVQARQNLKESEWLLKLADRYTFIKGIVGWVDLRSPRLKEQLETLSVQPKFRGVRHVVHDEPEIGVPAGERGAPLSQEFFRNLELRVGTGRTYRGRVISLESYPDYSGRGGSVKVHRLHNVKREDVILPQKTLNLLDRNVGGFIAARDRIKALRFSAKKGLLFYGPPGTGKTHTIHYLASQLPEHTTLLITAEQLGLLGEYFRLARFLQPAMMVIEDVDLIARERVYMQNPGQEILLNKLLNEMDGLREDADIFVILTTNRPDQLEPALASRPGRIDQAIEFPLPDEEGRTKLVNLYSRGLEVPAELMDLIVRRTKGASPAFIKELMRRSAQFQHEVRRMLEAELIVLKASFMS